MANAQIILLDGASSSGKTGLARQLQELAENVVIFRLSVDDFLHCFSAGFVRRICSGQDMDALHATVGIFHRTVAFAATLHDRVVVDHVLQFPRWRQDFLDLVGRDHVLYVQVFCPLEVLEAREAARGDRRKGLAKGQFEPVYSYQGYDLKIDTSQLSPVEGARVILKHLE